MPELPEVETIRRQLAPKLIDAAIVDAGAHWSAKFTPALDAVGTEIVGARRRGKYLLFDLDPGADGGPPRELVVHLGMTGRLAVHEPGSALALDDPGTEPHLRAWWRLDDDRVLTFHDIRRFGRIHVVDTGDYRDIPTLHALGPEPWDPDFNGKHLAAFVKAQRPAPQDHPAGAAGRRRCRQHLCRRGAVGCPHQPGDPAALTPTSR